MATPSAPVISNAPLASPNTLEYWWYPPTSDGGAAIDDYYLTLTSQYGVLSCNVGSPGTYYKATGLSNATTYFTTIAASNANGLGATASFREFQPGSPPPRGVSTTTATAVVTSPSAALVSWTPPFGYPPVPAATIFWYVINGYTTTDSLTPVLKYTAGGQSQSNLFITGLNSTIQYYFTVRAVNCPGWSVPVSTNTITFITSVAFAPSQLGSLNLWLDAADINTISTSSSLLSQWNDKSAMRYNLLQSTVSVQPGYSTSTVILSNARFLRMPQESINSTSNYSMVFVMNPQTTSNTIMVKQWDSINTLNVLTMSYTTAVGGTLQAGVQRSLYWKTLNAGGYISTPALTLSTVQMATITYNGTTAFMNINGSNVTSVTGTFGISNAITATNFNMGLWTTNPFPTQNVIMNEFLFYNSGITPYQTQKAEGYLAWKWGIQSNLPSIHPFRSAAPQSNSVFSPLSFSSLQLWLDASDISTVTLTSDRVTAWADKSGNGFNATTRYNGSNITYGLPINGVSTLTFVSTSISGTFSPSFTGSNTYAFFVGNHETTTNTYARVLAMGVSGQTDSNNTLYTNAFTRNNGTTQIIAERNSGGNAFVATTVTNTDPFLASAYNIPGSKGINANGGAITSNAGPSGPFNLTNYVIGGPTSNTTTALFVGRIGEILVYTQPLSTQDRQTVEGYLAWKWGLQGNLPTTHPYRYNNPGIVQFSYPNPNIYGNLSLWLDASQLTGLTNGGALTTWVDRSSNAYVGGASNGPTFITNSINGLPVVRFNGSSQYINFGNVLNISTNTGVAVFSVVKFNTTGSNAVIGKTIYGPGDGRWALTRDTITATMNAQFFIQSGGTVTESIYADTTTTTQLIEGTWDRQNQYIYQNGLQRDSDARATMSSFNTTYPLYAGAYPNGAGSAPQYYMNGDIAEILVYMANITPFIRQQIEGYLTWKWGLQASLPVTHPYFTAPPQQAYTTFTPTLYSDLQIWYDGADPLGTGTAPANGTSITTWVDKSGKNNNATAGVAASYVTDPSGNYLNFNGTTTWYNITSGAFIANQYFTVFIVERLQQNNMGLLNNFVSGTTTGVNTNLVIRYYNTNATGMNMSYYLGVSIDYTTLPAYTTTAAQPTRVWSFTQKASFLGMYLNGTLLISSTNNTLLSSWTGPSIGRDSVSSDRYYGGHMKEMLFFTGDMSTDNRQTVEGYLAWKWGTQGSLPVTHPYALINPANPTAPLTVTTTGLLIRFDATTYSGSGAWTNTGSLGTGYNATITVGQTPTKNAAGNGIVLNGSSGWTFANIGQQTSFTISGWFKLGATMATDFMAFITDGTTGTSQINMALSGRNSASGVGAQQFAGGFYDGTTWRITGITTLNLNTWYMLTASFDNSTKILTTYLNGLSVGTATFASSTPNTSAQVYRIGQQITGTASYITGEVGQVLIYSRALTATEVLQNFTATQNTFSV